MKKLKTILVIASLISIPFIINVIPDDSNAEIILIAVIGLLFVFHFAIRKSLFFKGYFLSPISILSEKYSSTTSYDIPIELMFEKTLEVLGTTGFRLVQADNKKFKIFATSPFSWRSWGENLYISFKEKDGKNAYELQFGSCNAAAYLE